jgi:hypothetical protein
LNYVDVTREGKLKKWSSMYGQRRKKHLPRRLGCAKFTPRNRAANKNPA